MKFQRIRDIREDNNLTQSDIAKYLFTSQVQYSRWERGFSEIPISILLDLANYYNVSIDYLTGRTAKKEINK